MSDRLESRLQAIFAAQTAVMTAYLFGSRASGRPRPDSDLDLAVVWDSRLDSRQRESAEEKLRAALSDELGPLGENADLLDLARAGATVGFKVIRTGKLLLARDRRAKVELEARIARCYDDEAPYRELFRKAALRAGRKMGAHAGG